MGPKFSGVGRDENGTLRKPGGTRWDYDATFCLEHVPIHPWLVFNPIHVKYRTNLKSLTPPNCNEIRKIIGN